MQTASQMSELIGQLKLLFEGVTLSRFCAPDFPGGSGWKLLTASLMTGSLCSGRLGLRAVSKQELQKPFWV